MNCLRGVRFSLFVSNFGSKAWNLVIQFLDNRILQKMLCTLALAFFCALFISSTPPFSKTTHGTTSVCFGIWWNKSFRYHGHLVIAYWTYETLSRRQVFLPLLYFGVVVFLHPPLLHTVQSETIESAHRLKRMSQLPQNCHGTGMMQMGCQDTSIIDHA